MSGAAWKIVEASRNVHNIRFEPHGSRSASWVAWVLVHSDEHLDSVYCRRDLLAEHHRMAAERNAVVIKVGDTFDAMGGKWDPRGNLSELIPELRVDDYIDQAVKFAADFYEPFRKNVALFTLGNHETSVRKRHHVDLLDRLAATLRDRGGIARRGGYQGWVRFMFCHSKGKKTRSVVMHYDHGWGGGGPVTMGLIDFNRKSNYVVAADIIVMGHVHRKMHVHCPRIALNSSSRIERRALDMIRCGTYKDEYGDGSGLGPHPEDEYGGSSDFHSGRGQGPRPLGGYWIKFTVESKDGVINREIIPT